ncbi:MAG: TonB family protein [Thermoanaerobaculia bacterium]
MSSPFPSARGASSPEIDLALRDDLTGVFNRRYFRTMLDRDWPAWVKAGWEVSLLAVDLDGFKEVNDTWGHRAGDAVLQTVAEILRRNFRDGDRLIRYGGDEFVVVLPGAGPAVARELAERARLALDRLPLSDPDSGRPLGLSVSFSLGVASFPSDGETGELVLATADRRLYEEKRSRRENPPRPRRWLLRPTLGAIALAGASLATWWTLRPRPDAPASAPAVAPAAIERAPEAVRVGESAEIGRLREEVARLTQALAAERRSDEQRALQARIAELEARLVRPPAAAPAPPAAPSAVPPTATTSAATVPAPSPPAAPVPAENGGDSHPASARPSVVEAPQLLAAPKPVYPPLARQRRREATIALEVVVDAQGRVTAAVPQGALVGLGFEEAAIAAARQALYRPGQRDGQPVEMKAILRIEFRLE